MRFGGDEMLMSLAMMSARDTKNPDNPIHSDPELAKKAGLSRPIAGGSHVLAFPLELILQAAGRYCLFHGAYVDVRWKAPVYADTPMFPSAEVVAVEGDRVVWQIDAMLADDVTAMTGQVTIPLSVNPS